MAKDNKSQDKKASDSKQGKDVKKKKKGEGQEEAASEESTQSSSGSRSSVSLPEGYSPRLLAKYRSEVVPALRERFGYKSPMEIPRLQKVVVNMGVGAATQNIKELEDAQEEMTLITGQRPKMTRATRSVAQFKVREGMPVGCCVTLRGWRMYDFLDRLINAALPRVRDFRGLPASAFDGRGNHSLGLREQIIFNEIDYNKVTTVRGMNVTTVTTAKSDEECRELLALLGMPFRKN